jgi:NTP pyrophosphatase (non-canonical NTP hydrolase)
MMVAALIKPGAQLMAEATPLKMELNHLAIAIPSEAGELGDALKRHTMYDKELNRENVVEELGDLEFFMQDLRTKLGITREETLEANMKKLEKRYQGTFSNQAAQDRADKAGVPPEVLDAASHGTI